MFVIFAAAAVLIFTVLTSVSAITFDMDTKISIKPYNKKYYIWLLIVSGLILRIAAAPFFKGYAFDMSCFASWSQQVFKSGFQNFYSSVSFADYPPGYLYILYIVEAIRSIFNIDTASKLYILLLKMPALLSDILCGAVIYSFARKHSCKHGLLLAALFIFNPLVLLDSALWGQVDSVLTLFMILALTSLYDKKHAVSAVFFAAALLIKPQALIIFPVYIFYIMSLIKENGIKGAVTAAGSCLCGAALFFAAAIPFSPDLNPAYIFGLYADTLGSYTYATLNAPNLYGLLLMNGKSIYDKFLFFDYNILSNILTILIFVVSIFVYLKNKDNKANIFAVPAFFITAMYTLSAKMHERYMMPIAAVMLLLYIVTENKRLLALCGIFNFAAFIPCADVLARDLAGKNPWISSRSIIFVAMSALMVAAFAYFTFILLKKTKSRDVCSISKEVPALYPEPEKQHLRQKDYALLIIMTAVYAVIAFVNLGSFKAPVTSWDNVYCDTATIDLGKTEYVDTFNFYNGRLATLKTLPDSDELMPQYIITVSETGEKFTEISRVSTSHVFQWYSNKIERNVRYIRLTAANQQENGQINEFAVYSHPDIQLQIKDVFAADQRNIPELFDEQDTASYHKSYMNGTHFDEIYHARTAYENLNGIEPYEWTHPPLGKLIIAVGIKIFGMNPFGWRFMGTLFGILMLPLMYLLAFSLFKRTKYAAVSTFLMMFDFMHFTQTRIATIDTYAVFFIMLMYLFMYKFFETNYNREGINYGLRYLFLSGLFFGIGAASKWTCIYAGAGLAVIFFIYMARRYIEYSRGFADMQKNAYCKTYLRSTVRITLLCAVFFIIIPLVIYALSYLPYAFLKDGNSYGRILEIQKNMFNYHSNLQSSHDFGSMWYTWPVMKRPIWYFVERMPERGTMSTISAFGNPAVWWLSILACAAMVFWMIYDYVKIKRIPGYNYKTDYKTVFLLLTGYLAQYLPWVGITRVVFIYHYFTSVPFIILIISYCIQYIDKTLQTEKSKKIFNISLGCYLGITVILFIMFYPVISGAEVSPAYVKALSWFDSWYFGG